MLEKKLYTLCVLLSLSCSTYAVGEELGEGESSSSISIAGPSSSYTPDQETDELEVSVSSPATTKQN